MLPIVTSLLPSNSTAFERSLGAGFSDVLPVLIREALNPETTPKKLLPHLAAHEGVRLWYDDWAEDRKRKIIKEWSLLAALIGTRAALDKFLPFVDAEVVRRTAYPMRFIVGRTPLNLHPFHTEPFTAKYVVKVPLVSPKGSFIVGKTALNRSVLRPVSLEPINRVNTAAVTAKSPETQYGINFAWKRPLRFGDNIKLDGSANIGAHLELNRN